MRPICLGDKFSLGGLGNYTLDELSLDIRELLELIRNENREIPAQTYENLLKIADDYNCLPTSVSPHVDNDNRYALITILVTIILHFIPSGDAILNEYNEKLKSREAVNYSVTHNHCLITEIIDEIQHLFNISDN